MKKKPYFCCLWACHSLYTGIFSYFCGVINVVKAVPAALSAARPNPNHLKIKHYA